MDAKETILVIWWRHFSDFDKCFCNPLLL